MEKKKEVFEEFAEILKEDIKRVGEIDEEENVNLVGVKDVVKVGKIKQGMSDKQIKQLLEKGLLWDYIVCDELDKKHKGDIASKEVIFMCALGRLVKDKKPYSFNCLVLSPSSAGKDHLIGSVLKLFPRDCYEIFARTSAKTFNYLHNLDDEPDFTYDGKIIYLKEITETNLNNEVMKELTSGEEEISEVPIPRPRTKLQAPGIDMLRVKGHPCVLSTTATTIPTDEIRNRFNIVSLDLSEAQIKNAFVEEEGQYDEGIKKFISDLKPRNVGIPSKLFNFIKKNFPGKKQREKRDFQKLLNYIKVIALFNGRKVANGNDYNRAKDIFMNAYSSCASIPLKDIDNRIVKMLERVEEPMSAKNIHSEIGGIIAIQNLYVRLRNLVMKEVLEEMTDRVGGYIVNNYVLTEEYKDKKPFTLPNYEQ